MDKFKIEINKYIENYNLEVQLFKSGMKIRDRGYLLKSEFLSICLWKSHAGRRLRLRLSVAMAWPFILAVRLI